MLHLFFQMIDHVGDVEEGTYEIYTCVEKIIKQVGYLMLCSFFSYSEIYDLRCCQCDCDIMIQCNSGILFVLHH